MNIIFLGTGSAFTVENFQTNFILESENKRLLIDAGSDTNRALHTMGMNYNDITDLYISHLHGDHCGGVKHLAFSTYFDNEKEKINLYGHDKTLSNLWNNILQGGLYSVNNERVQLKDYFNPRYIPNNGYFFWEKNSFELVQTTHIPNPSPEIITYGLFIRLYDVNKKIYFTADSQLVESQTMLYDDADIIIQDCEYLYRNGKSIYSGAHAHYEELKLLPNDIKRKMCLVHYQDIALKDSIYYQAIADGFIGFIKPSTKYEILEFINLTER